MTDCVTATAPKRGNKQKLLIIAGLPLLVMIAATLLFRASQNGEINLLGMLGTRNNGDLLQPAVEVSRLALQDESGAQIAWPALTHWAIVIPAFDGCSTRCLQNLMTTRQVHLALGRDEGRVRRVLLLIDAPLSADAAAQIQKEHPHIAIARTTSKSFDELLAPQPKFMAASTDWYLVDPHGWLMMHYADRHSGKDLLADLKHLLKYSSEK